MKMVKILMTITLIRIIMNTGKVNDKDITMMIMIMKIIMIMIMIIITTQYKYL